MKQGFTPLPSAPGYGAAPLPQGFVNPNAQKPIRPFFKVPSEGVYRMAEELIFNPPKAQRKTFQPLAGTKVSYMHTINIHIHASYNSIPHTTKLPIMSKTHQYKYIRYSVDIICICRGRKGRY
jgi:hypothetical protein